MSVTIRSDGVIERVAERIQQAPSWMPRIVRKHLVRIGKVVQEHMRDEIEEHRYKGTLSRSVTYIAENERVIIGPTAKRGRFDAGLILEHGTRPISRVPWMPIKRWAEFRGIPAFPVWWTIRTKGVKAHPFLERTLRASEGDIVSDVEEMGVDIVTEVASA